MKFSLFSELTSLEVHHEKEVLDYGEIIKNSKEK